MKTIDLNKRYNELQQNELNILKEHLNPEEYNSFLKFLKDEQKTKSNPSLNLAVHELYYILFEENKFLINRKINNFKNILGTNS